MNCVETKLDSYDIVVLDSGIVIETAPVNLTIINQGSSGGYLSIQTYFALSAVSALRVVRTNGAGQLVYADSSLSPSVLGVTFTSAIAGSAPIVILSGLLSDNSFNWQLEIPVFLGSDGFLTQIPPLDGWLIQVGMPVTPTTILINIQEAIQL